MERTVSLALVTYVDVGGLDRWGWLGDVVDVHLEHVARFDAVNVLPVNLNPEPVPQIMPMEKPAGNASLEAWQAYALSLGDDISDQTRNDLRDRYQEV